jgi:PKD repeat protein
MTSVDIGVAENGEPEGSSLQLSGTGTTYAEFTWQPPAAETSGQLNNDQSFGGAPLPEPSNYPTAFSSIADNITVTLTWTDATGTQLPSKYIVKVSDLDNVTAPVDGTPVADDLDLTDGTGAFNVNYGVETYTFYHLEGETEYFFEIYPYTNAGAAIDYKTDGTAPFTSATTEPVILLQDFESNTFGDWTAYSVTSNDDWFTTSSGGGALSTMYKAEMNGYQADDISNDWLISPILNLNAFEQEKMIFYSRYAFNGLNDELSLKYSTNYNGGDPNLATWTDLSFPLPTTANTWLNSGNIDLSMISSSTVTIAFQYLNVDPDTTKSWNVDEIVIIGYGNVPFISVTSPVTGDIWEQGTSHDITWTASNTQANVMIELTNDASSGTPTWTTLVASVPADAGVWTWLIPSDQATSDDCQIRITDITADAFGLSGIFSVIEPIVIPQLVITEIMYNPPESGNDSLEFIELYNADDINIDLEGFYFGEGVEFTFPAYTLAPGHYFLVAVDSVVFEDFYGMTAWQFDGALGNGGELLSLYNNYGMMVDTVRYDDADPWPTEPDGTGPSLVLCDPGLDNGLGENWSAAIEFIGNDGEGNPVYANPGTGCASWPVAQFSADNTVILTGGSVTFTDESTGDPTEWVWTFIGGSPGSFVGQTPPPVVYETPGTYNVILWISNPAGTSTEEKNDYIHVGDPPVADFSGNPLSLYEGETVDFADMSAGAPDTWLWEFEGGDPASSDQQNPQDIKYDEPGLYSVTLTVTNMFGTDVMTKEEYIDVLPVGIDEPEELAVIIYPNPNAGNFNLMNNYNEELRVEVYSVYGQLIMEIVLAPGENRVAFEGAAEGIYMVKFNSLDGRISETRKMIVR